MQEEVSDDGYVRHLEVSILLPTRTMVLQDNHVSGPDVGRAALSERLYASVDLASVIHKIVTKEYVERKPQDVSAKSFKVY
jgi:hypothetical protein